MKSVVLVCASRVLCGLLLEGAEKFDVAEAKPTYISTTKRKKKQKNICTLNLNIFK
jgi:hypothetical protein